MATAEDQDAFDRRTRPKYAVTYSDANVVAAATDPNKTVYLTAAVGDPALPLDRIEVRVCAGCGGVIVARLANRHWQVCRGTG